MKNPGWPSIPGTQTCLQAAKMSLGGSSGSIRKHVLPYSPRASAALSRKALLLLLLQDAAGARSSDNLDDQIDAVLDDGLLPVHLAELLEAVPRIGAFDEQPKKGQMVEYILPVKAAEAELNLEVLERLFEFYYVQPAVTKSRKAALNTKLVSAGEQPLAE
jgi:hypothetical protein